MATEKKICGYHGTDKEYGDAIFQTKIFLPSQSDAEWLGKGVYFYIKSDDAAEWCKKRNYDNPMILRACVIVKEDEYLDYDTEDGKGLIRSAMEVITHASKYTKFGENNAAAKNQHAIAMVLWAEFPELKVLLGTFPTQAHPFPVIKDVRPLRPEFCVRDSSYLREIEIC
ncbi:MAG: hypothetical protein FWF98_05635 [Dehalococcoidia bacterium]|nr:hypothetical protein [Dehalococcoidia bacterium]